MHCSYNEFQTLMFEEEMRSFAWMRGEGLTDRNCQLNTFSVVQNTNVITWLSLVRVVGILSLSEE